MVARLLASSAAILLVATSASALQIEAPAPAKERRLCKSLPTVGTLIAKRICMTPSEWKKFNQTTRRDADVLRNRGAVGRVPSKNGG